MPSDFQNDLMYFYKYDSYDLSSLLGPNGDWVLDADTNQPGLELVYSVDWTGAQLAGKDTRTDASNQLKYTLAMDDKTVLTLCNYHVTSAGGSLCPVMFVTGRAKPIDYKRVVKYGWNIANAP